MYTVALLPLEALPSLHNRICRGNGAKRDVFGQRSTL